MPRPRKAPRLYLEPARKDRAATWRIYDGKKRVSTGCSPQDHVSAQRALADYVAGNWTPPGPLPLVELLIEEVVAAYLKEHAKNSPSRDWLFHTARPVLEWWAGKTLSDINEPNCVEFVKWRVAQTQRRAKAAKPVSEQTARHELKTLRTAINWYHKSRHGPLQSVPKVTLPQRSSQRLDYYLTRTEVAARIRAARRHPQTRHVARLILIGVYTGTRPGAALGLKWLPSTVDGWFDLENVTLHRRGTRAARSKKRQPAARIHAKLLPHLKRWRTMDTAAGIVDVVHYQGSAIRKLRRSWESVRVTAGHDRKDGPHIIRHTAATWQMQAGTDLFEAAGYLGMTPETLWDTYGHHSPEFQSDAAKATPRVKRGRYA